MAIVQISKMQQRAGNLVDLPQLDNGELGWASDANRLFIGRTGSTYSSENIEVLTSYSNISLSQITGSDGGNLNINTAENGQVLTYVASTNTWENYTGNSVQLAGGKLNLGDPANITMAGGTIGYVLQTDGTGNLSWTAQTGGGGGGGSPGGANTSVQFNDSGIFGGSANFSFNKTTRVLNVNGNITANNFVGNLANGTTSIRISPTSGNLTFTTAGNTAMTIVTSTNVGIGTTTPAYKLEINDENNIGFAIREYSNVDGVTVRGFAALGTKGTPLAVTTDKTLIGLRGFGYNGSAWGTVSGAINFNAAETFTASAQGTYITFSTTALGTTTAPERVRINPDGNVGIGTNSPSYKLDVSGTGRFTDLTQFDNAITLKTATLNYVYFDDAVAFSRNGTGERMRIDANGKVLINLTASKTYGSLLQVVGGIQDIGSSASSSPSLIAYDYNAIDGTPTYSSAVVRKFGPSATGNLYVATNIPAAGWAEIVGINVQSGVAYGSNGAVPVIIGTNGTERMRIEAGGNVGIGTATPNVKFAINATDAMLLPVGNNAQRPTGAAGYMRFNSDTYKFEGYYGSAWASLGGGATGGGQDQIFILNGQTVTANYTIPTSNNAGTFGPVTINSGVTVTIPTGSNWTIV